MDIQHMSWRMFFIRIVEIICIVNLAILDIFAVQSFPHYKASASQMQTTAVSPLPLLPTAQPTALPTPSPLPATSPTVIQSSNIKEIFIPLGTGESNAANWTNVPGVIASIDSTKYTNIKQVVLEANITVPTANQTVWIQLYNMTDQHPVWNSQISMTGATQYIVSPPITLDPGNKLYQVQMYTQLQYPAQLTLARIHITLR